MQKRATKVIYFAVIVFGVLLSIHNIVMPVEASSGWVWGTIHINSCFPSDPCYITPEWCCYGDESNCCYDPYPYQ